MVKLLEPIITRFVRIIPTSAPLLKIMRAELYGCIAEPMPPYNGNCYMTKSFLVCARSIFNILDIFNINAFFVACFMYSYHNNLLPHTFNTTFVTNRQVHTYNTWNANNYRPYFCRRNIKQFTILHLGQKLWTSLLHNLTELTSYSSFKTSLKKYLIEGYKFKSPNHDMAAYIKS